MQRLLAALVVVDVALGRGAFRGTSEQSARFGDAGRGTLVDGNAEGLVLPTSEPVRVYPVGDLKDRGGPCATYLPNEATRGHGPASRTRPGD